MWSVFPGVGEAQQADDLGKVAPESPLAPGPNERAAHDAPTLDGATLQGHAPAEKKRPGRRKGSRDTKPRWSYVRRQGSNPPGRPLGKRDSKPRKLKAASDEA